MSMNPVILNEDILNILISICRSRGNKYLQELAILTSVNKKHRESFYKHKIRTSLSSPFDTMNIELVHRHIYCTTLYADSNIYKAINARSARNLYINIVSCDYIIFHKNIENIIIHLILFTEGSLLQIISYLLKLTKLKSICIINSPIPHKCKKALEELKNIEELIIPHCYYIDHLGFIRDPKEINQKSKYITFNEATKKYSFKDA